MTATPATTSYSCPVCGTVHEHQSERYKNHVCHTCEKETRCSHDRSVIGYNTGPMGGFAAWHMDRGDNECAQVAEDGRVWIGGTEYRMQEARFGGTVVTPLPPAVPSIRGDITWEADGLVQFSAGVDTGAFVGVITEAPGLRRFFVRGPSTWEWQVTNIDHHRVYKHGSEATETAAKERAVEVLDWLHAYEARVRGTGR